ncbi:hypothetical protein [Prosthecobacter sp.]|uniref:hypothetical protein n=1 Tax=Prosthecobacter sp. TaxID=1965333 RepID=UPI001D3562B2|nr:hypothetical protein [Prosthecobacter sp.]MCB1279573.1 hypothetical protein [Prosthecobacter sp.]
MTPSHTEDPTPQSRCRFALAWCDITPPANIYHRMWGAAKHDRATGVHRPLRATVAIFAPMEGSEQQIVLALDHCVMGATEHANLVAQAAEIGGVAREEILVAFSHTHGAGLMGIDRANLPGGDLIPPYLQSLGEKAGALVKQCLASLQPAGIVYGKAKCSLATHRDFWDGKQFVCGHNPGVPADDTVIVARVTDNAGQMLASIVNYACHPTTLAWENTLISPDYIGAMREVVERDTGAPCLFLQGASGELGPREGFVGDTAVADRNGRELGYAALSALTALAAAGTNFVYAGPVVSGATLGSWKHQPIDTTSKAGWKLQRWHEPLHYRPGQPTIEQTQAELDQFQADEATARSAGDETRAADLRALAERKNRLLHRLHQLPPGDTYPLQVVLWHIGDAIWLGVQGESYNLLQTELRRRFPDKIIVVASIAADWGASYLPPRELYDTGIYQESIAIVAAGSLEQLIEVIAERITVTNS